MIYTAQYTDIGGRPRNEDAVRIQEKCGGVLAMVADGLGGHGGGDRASQAAVQLVCDGWNGQADSGILRALILKAHEKVQSMQGGFYAMKTTAAVLALRGEEAVWAHAGDTRIYHFVDGRKVYQTADHSASQIAVTLGEITTEQIRFHEDRARVLRALGQEGGLKVETHAEPLSRGKHAFLLCTDGFWEYVLEHEMEADLCADSPAAWLDRMRARLAERAPEGNDNNTAAAVWLTVS